MLSTFMPSLSIVLFVVLTSSCDIEDSHCCCVIFSDAYPPQELITQVFYCVARNAYEFNEVIWIFKVELS
jgi:hypothetical protein